MEYTTPESYIEKLPDDKKEAFLKLRETIKENIPKGFEEIIIYGSIGFVIPKTLYPKGYHCKPELPLPFINIAAQKNFIALYHMGIYANDELLNWFQTEYPKYNSTKLDMGKSCIRFKKIENIPFELIGILVKKMTTEDWIETYENTFILKNPSK